MKVEVFSLFLRSRPKDLSAHEKSKFFYCLMHAAKKRNPRNYERPRFLKLEHNIG